MGYGAKGDVGGGGSNEVEIVGVAENLTLLDSTFPAANFQDKWAMIKGTIPQDEDGIYQSDGASWLKIVDDSDFRLGNRTTLWDYTTGLTFGATNKLRFSSGSFITSHDANNNAGPLFDGDVTSSGVGQIFHGGNWPNSMGKVFSGSNKHVYGKFRVNNRVNQFNETSHQIKQFQIQGLDDFGVWHTIGITVLVENAGGKAIVEGDNQTITFSSPPTESEWVEVETNNTTGYRGYRLSFLSNFGDPFYSSAAEFMGFEVFDNSQFINPVNSINKLHNIVKDFGEWIEDPANVGEGLYGYSSGALVKYQSELYKSLNAVPANSPDPQTDNVNWVKINLDGIEIIAESENVSDLETNFPAANNQNKWGTVQGTLPQDEDGLYRSNGTVWIKKLDDSDFKIGDRTQLWDFSGGLSYGNVNTLRLTPGASHAHGGGFQADPIFDDSTSAANTANFSHGGNFTQASCGKIFSLGVRKVLGKFRVNNRVDASNNIGHQTRQLLIQGRNDVGAWIDIPYGVISDDANGKVTGDGLILTYSSQPTEAEWLEVETNNTTGYTGYRLRLLANFGSPFDNTISEFQGFETIINSNLVNPVNSINKLHSIIEGFGTWIEDGDNPGLSLYDYAPNSIVHYAVNGSMYRNTSGGVIAAGSADPATDTANWTLIL